MVRFLRKVAVSGGTEAVNSVVPTEGPLHHGQALQGSDGLAKEFQWPAIILWMIWLVGMGNVWLGRAIRGVNATPRTVFMYGLSTKTRGEHRETGEPHHKATLPTNWPITKLRFQSPLTTLRIRQLVDQHRQPTARSIEDPDHPTDQPLQPMPQPTAQANGQPDSQPINRSNGQPEVGNGDSAYNSADLMARKSLNSLVSQ